MYGLSLCTPKRIIADWPSRGSIGFAEDLGASEAQFVIPQSDTWGEVGPILGLAQSDVVPPPRKRRRK